MTVGRHGARGEVVGAVRVDQGAGSRLAIRQVHAGGRDLLVCPAGELDHETGQQLSEVFLRLVDRPGRPDEHRRVLLDLSGVVRCDRGGLFTLLGICQALDVAGVGIVITELSTVVRLTVGHAGLGGRLPLRRG